MSHPRVPGVAGLVLGAALLLAACSSSSTATPTPSPTPAPTPPPTLAPASADTGSGSSGGAGASGAEASGLGALGGLGALHQAAGLEGRLPAQVCGTTAFKMSLGSQGLAAAAAAGLGSSLGGVLSGIGANTTFSLAIAAPDPASSSDCRLTFFAIQIQNGDPNAVMQAIVKSETDDGSTTGTASLGGKNVTVLTPSGGDSKTYFYLSGDTIFAVDAPDDTTAGQALTQLP